MSEADSGVFLDLHSDDALERVLSAARYAQVGRVADSVTHDVNNLLGATMAYAEIVSLEPGISDDGRRMLAQVVSSALRCSELVGGLTALTRKEVILAKHANVVQLFRRAVALEVFMLRRAKVTVIEAWPEEETTLVGDPPRLQLALSHLLTNAREALSQRPAGEARELKVSLTLLGEHDAQLQVWNSGPPIPEAVRAHMFEPLYTTRPAPHLGLGLFAARRAAELHDGALTYDPEAGFCFSFSRYPRYARDRATLDSE